MYKIILASGSPRRKELLKELIKEYDVITSNAKESYSFLLPKRLVPKYLSYKKAKSVYKEHKDSIVIGADTIVICNHQILGKPKDKDDVRRMITMLNDNTHIVVTGVSIISRRYKKSFIDVSHVTFRKMSKQEIDDYCNLTTIYDKAGAYAIQNEASAYISKIKGSYTNIVGLPIEKLSIYLNKLR